MNKEKRNPDFYYPLPECLTIKDSGIHGLGLFAVEDILAGTDLGTSHNLSIEDNYISRTPLGAFYNHSNNPNCKKEIIGDSIEYIIEDYRMQVNNYHLITLKNIKAGEELTASYTLYNPEQ